MILLQLVNRRVERLFYGFPSKNVHNCVHNILEGNCLREGNGYYFSLYKTKLNMATKKVAKKAAPKKAAKKAAAPKKAKAAAKPKAKRKPNAAFMKALTPSAALAAVVGSKPLPRTEVTKKVWEYIKKNKLQDAKNKRNINGDAALVAVFGGKKTVSMFEMTKLVNKHLS
jgi:chromatin remodeling complex protein RSC6